MAKANKTARVKTAKRKVNAPKLGRAKATTIRGRNVTKRSTAKR
jgi:hypothetical protein